MLFEDALVQLIFLDSALLLALLLNAISHLQLVVLFKAIVLLSAKAKRCSVLNLLQNLLLLPFHLLGFCK